MTNTASKPLGQPGATESQDTLLCESRRCLRCVVAVCVHVLFSRAVLTGSSLPCSLLQALPTAYFFDIYFNLGLRVLTVFTNWNVLYSYVAHAVLELFTKQSQQSCSPAPKWVLAPPAGCTPSSTLGLPAAAPAVGPEGLFGTLLLPS